MKKTSVCPKKKVEQKNTYTSAAKRGTKIKTPQNPQITKKTMTVKSCQRGLKISPNVKNSFEC